MHGERAGFNDPAWEACFLELFEQDPERLTEITQAEYAERGGLEDAEVIMWLIMRGALVGTSNLHIYAAMRGETLEAFQQTRNAPGALYSVAGKEAKTLDWDKAKA